MNRSDDSKRIIAEEYELKVKKDLDKDFNDVNNM